MWEYVASLMGLYKNSGAVSCAATYFLLIWSLYSIHHGWWEGSRYPWTPSWTRINYGHISIETATHSFFARHFAQFPLAGHLKFCPASPADFAYPAHRETFFTSWPWPWLRYASSWPPYQISGQSVRPGEWDGRTHRDRWFQNYYTVHWWGL